VELARTSPGLIPHETGNRQLFEVSTIGTAVVIAVMSIAFAVSAWLIGGFRLPLDGLSAAGVLRRIGTALAIALRSPAPALMLALILERRFPVTPNQRDLTRGFYQDAVWYVVDYVRELTWIPLLLVLLVLLKRHIMGDRELIPDGAMPMPLLWGVGILAGDFFGYWSHRLRHRYDVLWNFHAIHHSQRELNFFTQNRFHDIDSAIELNVRMFPLLMLNASLTLTGVYTAISLVHFRLHHSQIRANYGVLRYLLVTPQSHRIHHGRDPRHLNCNFGAAFSLWDRAFGTQYENHDEYPEELGIRDENFPIEQGVRLRDFPRTLAAQMIYPFWKMLRARA